MVLVRPVAGVALAGTGPTDKSTVILDAFADLIESHDATIATLSPSHGASLHADVTRSFYVPAGAGAVTTPGNLLATATGQVPYYKFADAIATDSVTCVFRMPSDWVAATTASYVLDWIPSAAASASAVRWRSTVLYSATGTSVVGAGTATNFTGSTSAKVVDQLFSEASQTLGTPTAGSLVRLTIARIGDAAGDTYTGDARFLGVNVSYTANQ